MADIPIYQGAPSEPHDLYHTLGADTLRAITDAFYDRIEGDTLLRPMFPDDLTEARDHQYWFLVQLFGGPPLFNLNRGAPRMRLRHLPFAIGKAERDAWLGHMLAAIAAVGIPDPEASVLRAYFESASLAMMNRP